MPVVLIPEIGTANPMRSANAPPFVIGSITGKSVAASNSVGDDQYRTMAALFMSCAGIEGNEIYIAPLHSNSRPSGGDGNTHRGTRLQVQHVEQRQGDHYHDRAADFAQICGMHDGVIA